MKMLRRLRTKLNSKFGRRAVGVLATLVFLYFMFGGDDPNAERNRRRAKMYHLVEDFRDRSQGVNYPPSSRQRQISQEVEKYMKERRAKVDAVCRDHPELRQQFSNNSIIEEKYKLFYCPVPKVASTFWSRVFHQLLYTYPVRSPFDVPLQDTMPRDFFQFRLKTDHLHTVKQQISNYHRLLYVRDAFSRILSAYVDKVLAPNPVNWKHTGERAIELFRKRTSHEVNRPPFCNHDATFPEVVSLATYDLWQKNVHYEPIVQRCSPCLFDFTVIGKMETFQQDASHMLTLLNISDSQIEFDKMALDVVNDAIDDSTNDALSVRWLEKSLQCISKEDVLRRILRKLQIRGIISWRQKLDLDKSLIETINSESFKKYLLISREKYFNPEEFQIQKKQAFLEAYGSLTQSQYDALWDVYGLDIDMFGSHELLSRTTDLKTLVKINTQAFNWKKDWDLTPVLGKHNLLLS